VTSGVSETAMGETIGRVAFADIAVDAGR